MSELRALTPHPLLEENLYASLKDWITYYKFQLKHHGNYRGLRMLQMPTDLEILRGIMETVQPKTVVEIGAYEGGRTLWLVDTLATLGISCQVVSVDFTVPQFEGVCWMAGDARTAQVSREVHRIARQPAIVIDDADHTYATCRILLELYADLVPVGSYYVVEDTFTSLLRTYPFPSGYEAAREFAAAHPEFVIDRSMEWPLLTLNPGGYLKRVP